MTRRSPVLALALSSVCFAAMAILVRLAAQRGLSTPVLVVWRMGFGALACLPILGLQRQPLRVNRPALMLWRSLIGAAAIVTYFWSLALLPVGLASLFNYCGPLFTALFAGWFLGERPSRWLVLGIAVAFAGSLLTLELQLGAHRLGLVVGLLSAAGQGAAITLIRKLRRSEGATTIFFWFAVVSTVCCLPFAAPHLTVPHPAELLLLLGIGLSSLVAQLLMTGALGYVPAATYALLSPLTPICALAAGALFLNEPLTLRTLLGAAIAIGGVALGSWRGPSPRSPPEEVVASEPA